MRRTIGFARLTTATAVLAVVLTACGEGEEKPNETPADEPKSNRIAEMSPPKILRAALKANRATEDVIYTGKLSYYFPVGVRAFEVTITATAKNCVEELTSDQLGKLTTRFIDDRAYSRGSAKAMAEALELPASAVEIIGNRWLVTERGDSIACGRVGLITDGMDPASCKPGGEGEVEGTSSVAVRCLQNAIEVRVDVAATGKPIILRMAQSGPSGNSLTIVDVDSGVRIEAPPKRDVIDTTAFE